MSSYRVDALHSDTYKIRGGLYRNTKEDEKGEEGGKADPARHKAKVDWRLKIGVGELGGRAHA